MIYRLLPFVLAGCGTLPPAPETPSEVHTLASPEAPAADPQAQAGEVEATACDVRLFVYESDPAGLTVYDAPKRGATALGVLPVDTEVTVTKVTGPWAFVTEGATDEGTALPAGWVGIELLTTNLRTPEEYGPTAKPQYRAEPSPSAAKKRIALPIESLTIKGCSGELVQAEWTSESGTTTTGWLDATAHCPSANTSC